VAHGTLTELSRHRRTQQLLLRVRDPEQRSPGIASQMTDVTAASLGELDSDGRTELCVELAPSASEEAFAEALVQRLLGAGIGISSLGRKSASLEQVFAELTRGEAS